MTQYCTFTVADRLLGIETLAVQEVIRNRELTPIPLAPLSVRGLINLRGQIVTVIDLRERLGLPRRGDLDQCVHVVANTAGIVVSLLVDSIGGVVNAGASSFERPPDTVDERTRALILGVHKLDSGLLLLLDVARTVDVAAAA